LLLLAGFFAGLVVLLLALGLAVTGNFTWIWLARAILVSAVLFCLLELAVIPRVVRVNQVRGPLGSYRLTDRTQGCTLALLGACLAVGLLFCGAVFDWLLEWQ
jgi:hypothetical protein